MPRINFSIASMFLLLALASCAPRPAPTETMTATLAATVTASVTPTPTPTPTETPVPGLAEGVITRAEEFFGGSFSVAPDGSLVTADGTTVEGIKIIAGENGGWAWVKAGETPEQDVTGTPEELAKTKYIVDGHETGDWDGPGWRLEKDGTLVETKTFTLTTGETWTMPAFNDIESSIAYVSAHAEWRSDDRDQALDSLWRGDKAAAFAKLNRYLPGWRRGTGLSYSPDGFAGKEFYPLQVSVVGESKTLLEFVDDKGVYQAIYADVSWEEFNGWAIGSQML